ncbi:MAG TPA: DinB family protein [Terriglobia bacterium]|nr:DinB family protein [Terriglobia bacterium]
MTSREFYLQRLKIEIPVTMQVLRSLPKDRLNYKPDDRSPSAAQLAWTLANELQSCVEAITDFKGEWKVVSPPPIEEILKKFEDGAKQLEDRVSKADEASWGHVAKFYYEGNMVSELPAGSFLWLCLFDSIHHRGQLSAYLRPMGGKVPAVYGPSADDNGYGAWQ